MKNMNKRLACSLLAIAMSVGMLAGCGGTPAAGDADPVQAPNAAQEEYEKALQKEEQERQDAVQVEIDKRENNTKPATDTGDAPNKGDGGGMAGLTGDGDGPDGSASESDPSSDGGDTQASAPGEQQTGTTGLPDGMPALTMESLGVPEWSGQPWVPINGGTPYFSMPESRPRETETYASLDVMRRPGSALCITMERAGDMTDYAYEIKAGTLSVPGWNEDAYPGVVADIDPALLNGSPASGKLVYMRRLIGSGLGKLEQGRKNSMVCTEYMGEYGLGVLEDAVLRYIERTGRRVIYRVTPVFEGKETFARGAVVEAMSWGDSSADIGAGRDLCFNMFVYNVQPGVSINYLTGTTDIDDNADPNLSSTICGAYILDTARRQAHVSGCPMLVTDIAPAVQSFWYGSTSDLAAWSMDWNSCDCMDGVLSEPSAQPSQDASDPPAGSTDSDVVGTENHGSRNTTVQTGMPDGDAGE